MVLNEIVRGAAGIAVATQSQCLDSEVQGHSASKEDLKAAVVSIMEEYTSLSNWHLITVSEETERDQDQQVRFYKFKTITEMEVRHGHILSKGRCLPSIFSCKS